MVELKTEAQVEAMAAAGAVVAEALRAVAEQARPGQSTTELDKVAADVLARYGAQSSIPQLPPRVGAATLPRGALCQRQRRRRARHPNGQVLADGDLVSFDFDLVW
jgi:methionyl aminopeptidase